MYNFELLMLKKFIYGLLSYNQRSTLVALVILQHVIKRDLWEFSLQPCFMTGPVLCPTSKTNKVRM